MSLSKCFCRVSSRQISLLFPSGRQPENYQPYEDSLTAKVQGKLMQYFDIMSEGKRQSQRDKETIQGLVSDISHQVKTPIANIKMFTGILRGHDLPPEKRAEFAVTLDHSIHMIATAFELWDFGVWRPLLESTVYTGLFAVGRAVLEGTFHKMPPREQRKKHKKAEETT